MPTKSLHKRLTIKTPKRKAGRPPKTISDYLPQNWQQVIFEMSADGCSDVEIRARFIWDGDTKTFSHNAWDGLKEHEVEFLTTIKKAKVLCQAWWERTGREGLHDPNFQTGNWYANMKNRFGWHDKQTVEHELGDSFFEKFAQLSESDLEVRYRELSRN